MLLVLVNLHISSKQHRLFEVSKGPHELPESHNLGLVLMKFFDLKPTISILKPTISILTGMIVASKLLFLLIPF